MNRKNRCLLGFLGITVVGTLLHNAYLWTAPFPLFALIAPVNESVWEHLKMAYWGVLIYALIESSFFKIKSANRLPSLALGSSAMILAIVIVFYSYTSQTGKSVLWVDITTFMASALVAQVISCHLRKSEKMKKVYQLSSLIYLIIMALLFAFLTYYPPEFDIFIDHSASQIELNHSFF